MVYNVNSYFDIYPQPTSDVFQLFDTLLLLSKGRVAYTGATDRAVTYFSESPAMQFNTSLYFNPADFLLDISGCLLKNIAVRGVSFVRLDYGPELFFCIYRMKWSMLRHWRCIFALQASTEIILP